MSLCKVLQFIYCYAECHHAEGRYHIAECHYAECRGAASDSGCSTVVEHSPHHLEVKGLAKYMRSRGLRIGQNRKFLA